MKVLIVLAALFIVVACAQHVGTKCTLCTPSPVSFRNEFDTWLVASVTQRFHEIENELLELSEQIAALEKDHSEAKKEKILRKIAVTASFAAGSKGYVVQVLKRDAEYLNLLERFNFQAILSTIELLDKDLKAITGRVSSIKTH